MGLDERRDDSGDRWGGMREGVDGLGWSVVE